MKFARKWIELENILREVTQTQTDKGFCSLSHWILDSKQFNMHIQVRVSWLNPRKLEKGL